MFCPSCGKACANRMEVRRVRLAGKCLLFCNVCSLHALAAGGGGQHESALGIPGSDSQTGELAVPPDASEA